MLLTFVDYKYASKKKKKTNIRCAMNREERLIEIRSYHNTLPED